MATVGAVNVNLSANTAQFSAGLKNAQSGLDRFAKNASAAFAAVASAAAAMGGALALAVKSNINEADRLGKMSQKIGIPVEELSRLKHAADLSGVSLDALGTAVNRFNRNLGDIASGKVNDASRALDALGISAKNADGSLKSSSQVMSEVAGKFATMQDGANKSALAMAVFGRSGAELIPLLNQGADGLEKMKSEAERLGIVIDANTARAAENFNDNLTRLRGVMNGMVTQITAQLAPALSALSTELIGIINLNIVQWAQNVVDALNWIADVAGRLTLTFRRMGEEIAAVGQMARGDIAAGWERLKKAGEDYHQSVAGMRSTITGFWTRIRQEVDGTADAMTNFGSKVEAPIMKTAEAMGKADKEAEKFQKTIERMAKKVYEATETAVEKFGREMAKLNFLLEVGQIDVETYGRAVRKLQDDFTGITEASRGLHSALGSAFADAVTQAKSLQEVAKSLLKDLAKLAANFAFRQLLGTGTGGNWGLLGNLFGGAPRFATGGSFRVSGSGGTDSQPVMFWATPGEQVTVATPAQQRHGEGVHVTVSAVIDKNGTIIPVVQDVVRDGISQFNRTLPDRVNQIAVNGSRVR